ncbi:phospholipid scramblase-related protein [Streptantibioticus ferralitis]|uniref:Phospholipid scramblase-related protein n=1 Tax=Streptantibioticus ferralitis TaxID=236510 RepID=A0ABT5YYJ9_9ACTN|nr:phospholipid scramblase-related protein [Streptantibioticus ferralitis]MDF2256396.1 phospholipid scramblase-related protein [Streptantibioticus ferralitis]
MTTHSNIPAGWYADPHGAPNLLRWWDGSQWTDHTHADTRSAQPQAQQQAQPQAQQPQPQAQQPQQVQQQAQAQPHIPQQQGYPAPQQGNPQQPQQGIPPQGFAPQAASAPQASPNGFHDPSRIQRQVQHQAGVGPTAGGGGTVFTEPILVVNQKAKLIEMVDEYSVYDQAGRQIGSVAEIGQSAAKKAVRALTRYGQFMTHRLEVRDAHGQPLLYLTRPAKFIKSKMIVQRPDGAQIGEIVQQNAIGKINFAFMVGDQQIGAIKAENFRAWNFAIVDHTGAEVARITKTWQGLTKAMFTSADNYVLQIHQPLADPLLSMVVGSALTVDTALKQGTN